MTFRSFRLHEADDSFPSDEFPEDDIGLSASRGMYNGMVLSIAFWAAVLVPVIL